MSNSQKSLSIIPRSIKSSSNLRKQSKRSSITSACLQPQQKFNPTKGLYCEPQQKFKPILQEPSSKNLPESNELDSRYNVYKYGSPNFYSYNLESHKASNIKNSINSLDLPFIDGVIKELKSAEGNLAGKDANMRDLSLYPSLLKHHQTHKFKELLSDKQEMRDFVAWFGDSMAMIDGNGGKSEIKRFRDKQIVISAAFGEMVQQVSKLSKVRAQIMRMLWNRQTEEIQQIVQKLTQKTIDLQKQHLQTVSSIHLQYQQQIDSLKSQVQQLSEQLTKETVVNRAYVNTLRGNRKTIKKYELAIKKLLETNESIVKENLELMDQSTKLMVQRTGKALKQGNKRHRQQDRRSRTTVLNNRQSIQVQQNQQQEQLTYNQARILLYRRLQIRQQLETLSCNYVDIKKNMFSQIKQNSLTELEPIPETELRQKQEELYAYILERLQENPQERQYLKEDLFHEDDHEVGVREVEDIVRRIIAGKEVRAGLARQEGTGQWKELRSVGVGTNQKASGQVGIVE